MSKQQPPKENAPAPPHDLDAEEMVLGAMMLSASAVDAVSEILLERDFYRASHGRMFRTMLSLHAHSQPVDLITVAGALEQEGVLDEVGGRDRVQEIAAHVPAARNAAHYAAIVHALAGRRQLIQVGDTITRAGWDGGAPTPDLFEQAEQAVFQLATSRTHSDFAPIGAVMPRVVTRLQELAASGESLVGLSTGFAMLDDYTSGLQPGNLVVIAGRPSMGKTAFALTVAASTFLRRGLPVALFTLEMSRTEVVQRLLSSEALVESQRLRAPHKLGMEEWQRIMSCAGRLERAPLFIEDSSLITLMELRSKARRLKLRNPNLAMLVVDYLQLMTSGETRDNRVQEVSQISRVLKVLAGELEVPVLALSQLSRQVESRHDKRPMLSDLRESGSIEQDADVVMFLYRDEYYHPEDTDQSGIAEVHVAKQRNGPTGMIKVAFVKRYARFSELLPVSATARAAADA